MDALSKECEGIKCDRDVALLALKQSVALKGEHEREQMEDLKVHLSQSAPHIATLQHNSHVKSHYV